MERIQEALQKARAIYELIEEDIHNYIDTQHQDYQTNEDLTT